MGKENKIAFFDSIYSLFLFFLIYPEKIKTTTFLVSDGIPENVRKNINCIYSETWIADGYDSKKIYHKLKYIFEYRKKYKLNKIQLKEANLLGCSEISLYGQDHIMWGHNILDEYDNIEIFEDGFLNYTYQFNEKIKYQKIKKILKIRSFCPFGLSRKISKIYLTGLAPTPELIKDKVEIVNLQNLWNDKSLEEKEMILNIFNISISKMENMSQKKVILLTQTLSEDQLMSEEEKITLYREMLQPYKVEDVLIKPHPREKTDYSKYFPECEVVSEQFPVQLFKMNNIKFKEVVTVFSTAANDFLDEETKLVFKGTEFDNRLSEIYGNISYNEVKREIEYE